MCKYCDLLQMKEQTNWYVSDSLDYNDEKNKCQGDAERMLLFYYKLENTSYPAFAGQWRIETLDSVSIPIKFCPVCGRPLE